MAEYTDEQMYEICSNEPRLYLPFVIGRDGTSWEGASSLWLVKSWDTAQGNEIVAPLLAAAEEKVAGREYADEQARLEDLGYEMSELWDAEENLLWYGADDFPDGDIYGIDPRLIENEEDGARLVESPLFHDVPAGGRIDFFVGDAGTYIAPYAWLIELVDYVPDEGEPAVHPAAVEKIEECRPVRDTSIAKKKELDEKMRTEAGRERARHMDETDEKHQPLYSDRDIDDLCSMADAADAEGSGYADDEGGIW